jgi:hypothetical protein
MTQPNFPLIVIDKNEVLNLIPTETDFAKPTAFGVTRQTNQELAFDGEGNKWTYNLTSSEPKEGLTKMLLKYILYNPVIDIKPEWTKQDIYQLQELKEVINRCIMKTNDATQLVDMVALKSHISQANSYADLYKTLNKYLSK